ncbi:MAG: hypothetical protein HYW47_03400 [Deltaproteobacteria bacterium]|nr:hypothetical protein [Deltaproteobacteria bacterium]
MMEKELKKSLDPLYLLFKKEFKEGIETDLDRFIMTIIDQYLAHIVEAKIMIPEDKKEYIIKQLIEEVEDMIRKTFMGCLEDKNYLHVGRVKKIAS